MGFISVMTFCLGTAVADAPQEHCVWAEWAVSPWESEAMCELHLFRVSQNIMFMNNMVQLMRDHPDYDGEWTYETDCVSEEDWPEYERETFPSPGIDV